MPRPSALCRLVRAAVLGLNWRGWGLEALAFMLDHGEAKALIVDPEFAPVIAKALQLRERTQPILVIQVDDALYGEAAVQVGSIRYEDFVAQGDAAYAWELPEDVGIVVPDAEAAVRATAGLLRARA